MTQFDSAFRDKFMAGQASEQEIVEAMRDLIETGQLGSARGYYRRLAQSMLDGGWFPDLAERHEEYYENQEKLWREET